MDGVIVDFGHQVELVNYNPKISDSLKSSPDQIEGIFKNQPQIKNSIESIIKLHNSELYDLFIATTAPGGTTKLSRKSFINNDLRDNFGF